MRLCAFWDVAQFGISRRSDLTERSGRSNDRVKRLLRSSMRGRTPNVLYALLLVIVIVGVDLLFFKNRHWARLMVNVGMVLVFAAAYFLFLKRR